MLVEDRIYFPPQDSLFPLDTLWIPFCNRVILTGKPSDQKVMRWDLRLCIFYISANMLFLCTKMFHITFMFSFSLTVRYTEWGNL